MPVIQAEPIQGTGLSGQALPNPPDAPNRIGATNGTNTYNVKCDVNGNLQSVGAAPNSSTAVGAPVQVGGVGTDGNAYQILVNAQNQQHVNTEGQKKTYSASTTGFTPVATPTDFFNIFGSGTKTIRITRIEISGTSTSATPGSLDLQLIKRSSIGTIGSAVLANLTATPHDSANAAGTAVPSTVGTANYGALGTLVGVLQARKFFPSLTPLTATDYPITRPHVFDFSNRNEQAIVLRGVTEQLALGFNGGTLPAGLSLDINITWSEE